MLNKRINIAFVELKTSVTSGENPATFAIMRVYDSRFKRVMALRSGLVDWDAGTNELGSSSRSTCCSASHISSDPDSDSCSSSDSDVGSSTSLIRLGAVARR